MNLLVQLIIMAFGALLLAAGFILLFKPGAILGFLDRNKESPGIHVLGVVVRLILGAALIVYSANSPFPLTFEVLGWITVAAGVVLALMGRSNFKKLMSWAMGFGERFGRFAGLVAMLFGGFLVYSVT